MGLPRSNDGKARFLAYVEGLTSVIGHATGPSRFAIILGFDDALRRKSVEPMAAITAAQNRPRPAASVAAALYRRGKMVGREGSGEGAGTGAARAGTSRTDRSVDHRRHELSQERAAFGRGGSTILRRAWQAGQLSGRGDIVDRQSRCELAGGLSAVLAKGMGERSQTSAQGRSSSTRSVSRPRPDRAGARVNRWRSEAGLSRGAVLMDAGYGVDTDLRTSITALGLSYVAGIQSRTTVWAPGTGPRPPKKWSGHGRPPKLLRRDDKHKPTSVKELALALPKRAWRTITWRTR